MLNVKPGDTAADYAAPGVSFKADRLKAHGFKFVVRYINGTTTSWKVISPDEIARLFAAGLGLLLVWETSTTRPFGGGPAGRTDGAKAKADAYRLGVPPLSPILIAVDTDVTSRTAPAVRSYVAAFRAAASPYPVGVYGDYDTIEACKDLSTLNWQANAAGWSGLWGTIKGFLRRTHPLAHVLQERQAILPAIGTVDPNTVLRPFAVWDGHLPVVPAHPSTSRPCPSPALRKGATGSDVRYLQEALRIIVDGKFLAQTDAAVRHFQHAHGLVVDGLVGPQTWPFVVAAHP